MTYAYIRVSTKDQNLDRQMIAMQEFGVLPHQIYSDKESGKNFERTSYSRLKRKLRKGDLLVIKSIDRLGRNYTAIIEEWSHIVNVIGANIVVLDMPLLDTRSKPDSLVGKFISDIVLQVLSFVAENERVNTKQRQAEGIAAAKAKGIRFGRPCKQYDSVFLNAVDCYMEGSLTLPKAAALAGMKQPNFCYHLKRYLGISQIRGNREK